ncbi:hypothetical protein Tco_1580577 [Tanacetum coccineum]
MGPPVKSNIIFDLNFFKKTYSPPSLYGFHTPQYSDSFQHIAHEDSPIEFATPPLKSKLTRGRQKRTARKRYKTSGSSSFNTESGDTSINLNVDVGDDEEDEVQELRRPIGRNKAKVLKKKGPRSSGSSSSTNDEAFG